MKNQIKAMVKGQYQYPGMKEPKQFDKAVTFTLHPPKDGADYYGTGCYMSVDFDNGNHEYVDVRYEGTTDLRTLAERFMKNYWGSNLREYAFD